MTRRLFQTAASFLMIGTLACNAANAGVTAIPEPFVDAAPAPAPAKVEQIAVVAGGCFWGVEAVFEHVKGVTDVTVGYSGGTEATAQYEMVSAGETGHAESIRITYDPSQITFGQLLRVFFSVAHDPTELNRQGPDTGTHYRSAIFYSNEDQKRIAHAYIDQLNQAKVYARPVVTQVVALQSFYKAEAYHQDYVVNHPDEPYIVIHDLPKVENLRKQFPELYVKK